MDSSIQHTSASLFSEATWYKIVFIWKSLLQPTIKQTKTREKQLQEWAQKYIHNALYDLDKRVDSINCTTGFPDNPLA